SLLIRPELTSMWKSALRLFAWPSFVYAFARSSCCDVRDVPEPLFAPPLTLTPHAEVTVARTATPVMHSTDIRRMSRSPLHSHPTPSPHGPTPGGPMGSQRGTAARRPARGPGLGRGRGRRDCSAQAERAGGAAGSGALPAAASTATSAAS